MSSVIDHEVQGLVEEHAKFNLENLAQDLHDRIEGSQYEIAKNHPNWHVVTFQFMGLDCPISLWYEGAYHCVVQCNAEQVGNFSGWLQEAVLLGKSVEAMVSRLTQLLFHAVREKYVLDKLLKVIPGSISLFGRIMVKPPGATHELYANIKYFTKAGVLCDPPHTSIEPSHAELSVTQGYALGETDVARQVLYADLTSNFVEDATDWFKAHLFKLPTTDAPTPEDFE